MLGSSGGEEAVQTPLRPLVAVNAKMGESKTRTKGAVSRMRLKERGVDSRLEAYSLHSTIAHYFSLIQKI